MHRNLGRAMAAWVVLLAGCVEGGAGSEDGGAGSGNYPCGSYAQRRAPRFVDDGAVCPPAAPVGDPEVGEPKAALQELAGCGELLTVLQDLAIARMEEAVAANRAAALRGDQCFTYVPIPYCDDPGMRAADGSSWDAARSDSGGTPGGPEEYSETNNQVPGVDEADFLKTDGSYIYILADGRLQIIASWPPESARVVGDTAIEGEPTGLFIWGDRVVVYSALGPSDPYGYGFTGRCTYGYDCDFTGDGRDTKIAVFDVIDRTHPRLLRETRISGSFISSRRIQEAVFTVLHFALDGTYLPVWPPELPSCADGWSRCGVERAFDDLLERNRAALRSPDPAAWLPAIRDTIYEPGGPRTTTNALVDCTKAYASDLADGSSLLAVVSFDAEALDPLEVTTILGSPGATYATADSLYIASRQSGAESGYRLSGGDSYGDLTTVHKFALRPEAPEAEYVATGVAEGRVLNQFAMDEYDGRLRIATTTGWLPNPDVHNTLSVLEPSGGELAVVGKIDDIAPSEDIRAVRFDGPRGFIVTFKKTDPLFALDLADPVRPRIAGELFIPGFSTYIHLMDATHLMTIGYDADDMGDFAWFDGIQLQIFDIADLASPTLLFRELIGTRGSTSDAATNHLAFNYFPPRDALAIPMVICEGGGDGTYGMSMTFSGLLVYRVTTADGFALLGRVSHADTASAGSVSCGSWWTASNSQVQRSIFMDDYVFSVAPDAIKINRLDALGDDLVVIDLLD